MPNLPAPEGWNWTPLSSVARLESGHTPSRRHPEYWGGSIPWIGIRDATGNHGRVIHETIESTNEIGIENSSARVLPKDTVCLSRTASVGYVVVMGRPMSTSQDFVNWICSDKLNPHFLKYVLLAEREALLMFAVGSVHQTIYFPEAKAFYICMPDRNTQDSIVEVLGALDEKIELNRRTNETLEAMARALFKDWFVDFGPTRAKMEGRAPYLAADIWSLFPNKIDNQGKPEDWSTSTLKEIAFRNKGQIRTGPFGSQLHRSDYLPVGIPVVMPANLTSGEIVEDGIARIGAAMALQLSDHAMTDGDIVYGRRGDIGRKALVGPDEAGWICGTGCLRISIRSNECPPLYLFYHLDRPDVREWISARAIGATMPNLNTGILGEVEVLLPGVELAAQITLAIEPMFHRMRFNRRENQTLAGTRDFLLPKLMSGEVHVRDAEGPVGEAT
nr:restriction modification system DNA specificity domain [Aureimonas sp. AU12]